MIGEVDADVDLVFEARQQLTRGEGHDTTKTILYEIMQQNCVKHAPGKMTA